MSIQSQLLLAESPYGRITLHLIALFSDHKLQWHLKGIKRELFT